MSGSDDKSSKTEKPTPHKLREAKKKGQVSKSKDVTSFISTVSLTLMIYAYFSYFWQSLMSLKDSVFNVSTNNFDQVLPYYLHNIFEMIIYLSLPVVLVALVSAIVGNAVQIGFIFSWHPVTPDINKLNPVKGLERIFGMKNFVDFLRSLLKLIVLTMSIYMVIRLSIADMFFIVECGIPCAIDLWAKVTLRIVLLALILFMVLAIFDYWYQRHHFMTEQKMSKDDVKREHKSMEGDPQIKGKRKQLHRETASEDVASTIKDTTLFIYSGGAIIGLRYKFGETPLPVVTMIAKKSQVRMVSSIAKKLDKPLHEDNSIAIGLMNNAKVNEYIPTKMITEVAEIFSKLGLV